MVEKGAVRLMENLASVMRVKREMIAFVMHSTVPKMMFALGRVIARTRCVNVTLASWVVIVVSTAMQQNIVWAMDLVTEMELVHARMDSVAATVANKILLRTVLTRAIL